VPETFPSVGEFDGAQVKNRRPGVSLPAPAAAREARLDQFFATGFSHTTANWQAGRHVIGILHLLGVVPKGVDLSLEGVLVQREMEFETSGNSQLYRCQVYPGGLVSTLAITTLA